MKIFKFPWKHLVLDNFLTSDEFNETLNYAEQRIDINNPYADDFIEIHHYNRNSILNQIFNNKILLLKDLYYEKLNFANKKLPENFKPYIALKSTKPNTNFFIHTDQDFKLMSSVLYLYPKKSSGTNLYLSNNGSNSKNIIWKQNRLLSFVGQSDPNYQLTWHNYTNETNYPRITIILILSS